MTDLRVLIVEDEPRIADLHRRFTERVPGFRVVGAAETLTDAAEQAAVLEPDLILLDLYFPEGNGIDLLKQLRAEGRSVDVILITAAREVSTLQDAVRGGAFDYIIKPVVFGRFEEALEKFRAFRLRLEAPVTLEQTDVDEVMRTGGDVAPAALPRGIDGLTLGKVTEVMQQAPLAGLGADDVAARMGASRSTARRYLEYLAARGELEAEVAHGGVGRPQRLFRRARG